MRIAKHVMLAVLIIINTVSFGQKQKLQGWHLLDKQADSIQGISLQKTYEFLSGRKSTPLIVAVIDGGVDTTQEDLKNILWRNPKEIAGNKLDDDGNGYVDDIYGWNFLGGKDGKNISSVSSEASRVYHKYKQKFGDSSIKYSLLSDEEKEQYDLWKHAAHIINVNPDEQVELMFLEMAFKTFKKNEQVLREAVAVDTFTVTEAEKFAVDDPTAQKAKLGYLTFMKLMEFESDETNYQAAKELDDYITQKKSAFEAKNKAPEDYRSSIVKDNYYNINDRFYGNSDVMGPDPMHGTHVSGIIAEQRGNGLGLDGIADNVKIMMIRAVPDGDEYDKDIALAIKYAVDNGARVINMSFGKEISPEKKWVDDAVRYAESNDVLIVHAAGNDRENTDTVQNYPSPQLKAAQRLASNFITVGASSDPFVNGNFVADFSNYGKKTVDVFAPGVKIYSTLPGASSYGYLSGTSMASPVVAGVAALIRSYFPYLTASQVKYAIEKSAVDGSKLRVSVPGTKEKASLDELCTSGGILNAYNAVKLASTLPLLKVDLKKTNQNKSKTFTLK